MNLVGAEHTAGRAKGCPRVRRRSEVPGDCQTMERRLAGCRCWQLEAEDTRAWDFAGRHCWPGRKEQTQLRSALQTYLETRQYDIHQPCGRYPHLVPHRAASWIRRVADGSSLLVSQGLGYALFTAETAHQGCRVGLPLT